MSANFNIAMLRSIQQPLSESMEAIIAQLTRLLAGQIKGHDLDQGQHAKLVRGSLEMIGCQAISRLALTLEKGCEALVNPDRRGWDAERVEKVGTNLLLLAEGLDDQIKHMLVDNEDLPVRLWPAWARVHDALGDPAPVPEDLFEPDPNFEEERFQPLSLDFLQQVCSDMTARLQAAIQQLESAEDGHDVAKSLREAERVFNWAYGLRHRRGYQAYWLVMRARMAIGLIQDPSMLEDKAEWTVLLNEALLELQKFAKDALRVRPELLLKVIRPLLKPWPESWTYAHPALAEMDSRMGLSVFWKTVSEVQDQVAQEAITKFVAHQEELLGLISRLKGEWTRYVSGEGRPSDPNVARAQLLKTVKDLYIQRMLFSDPSAIVMLDAISRVSERMPVFSQITDAMALEYASSILVVEDSVERRGRVSPEFHEQSRLQQKRLGLAWDNHAEELKQVAVVRWDAKKQERQTRHALSAVFLEIKKDLIKIEESLADHFRGESNAPFQRDQARDVLSLADAVLRMLMCPKASEITKSVLDKIGELSTDGRGEQVLQDEITLGITGLTSFLGAREGGDDEAERLLSGSIQRLLGEQQYQALNPDLLVPPPAADVISVVFTEQPEEVEAEIDLPRDSVELEKENLSYSIEKSPILEEDPIETATFHQNEWSQKVQSGIWESGSEKDTELVEFLLEEVESVLSEIERFQNELELRPTEEEDRIGLRRQFHTLKGSGRIAGLFGLAEIAWWMEQLLNHEVDNYPSNRREVSRVVDSASDLFRGWFEELQQQGRVWVDASDLRRQIDNLQLLSSEQSVLSKPSHEKQDEHTVASSGAEPEFDLSEGNPFNKIADEHDEEFLEAPSVEEISSDEPTLEDIFNENWQEDTETLDVVPLPTATLEEDKEDVSVSLGFAPSVEISSEVLIDEDVSWGKSKAESFLEVSEQNEEAGSDDQLVPALIDVSSEKEYGNDSVIDRVHAQTLDPLVLLSEEEKTDSSLDARASSPMASPAVEERPSLRPSIDLENVSEEAAHGTFEILDVDADLSKQNQPVILLEGAGSVDAEQYAYFEEDAYNLLLELKDCVEDSEADRPVNVVVLHRVAHTFASLTGTLGLNDYRQLSRAIERSLDIPNDGPQPPPLVLPQILAQASRELVRHIELLLLHRRVEAVDQSIVDELDNLLRREGSLTQRTNSKDQEVDAVLQNTSDIETDELLDLAIDEMVDLATRLQRAIALLAEYSERRR